MYSMKVNELSSNRGSITKCGVSYTEKKQQQKHMIIFASSDEIVNFPVYNIYILDVLFNQNRANNWTNTVLNEILPYKYIVLQYPGSYNLCKLTSAYNVSITSLSTHLSLGQTNATVMQNNFSSNHKIR